MNNVGLEMFAWCQALGRQRQSLPCHWFPHFFSSYSSSSKSLCLWVHSQSIISLGNSNIRFAQLSYFDTVELKIYSWGPSVSSTDLPIPLQLPVSFLWLHSSHELFFPEPHCTGFFSRGPLLRSVFYLETLSHPLPFLICILLILQSAEMPWHPCSLSCLSKLV